MKKIQLLLFVLGAMLSATTLWAQTAADATGSAAVENLRLERNGDYLALHMDLRLDSVRVGGNNALLVTPRLSNGTDAVELKSVGIYSRKRYYHYLRANGDRMLSGADEVTLRASRLPDRLAYEALVPYADWMEGATLTLLQQTYGCCQSILAELQTPLLSDFRSRKDAVAFAPAFAYVQPQAEPVKTRALSGSAYINFPVNRTDIQPDHGSNRAELAKITATIDSVKADGDIRITALSIKGFASPEGSYAGNERLARGRTESLRSYVQGLYDFPADFIRTAHEAEDWEGLRRYIDASGLTHRAEMLAVIDDAALAPDAKERKLRTAFPADYRFLLERCYPQLRRSDYRVEYIIRSFTDVAEIRAVMQLQPQKLSLEEFFLVAQTLEPGSEAYNEVFETAVRMYPADPVANLNAANSAMSRRDLKSARRYLAKAGDVPQAIYARGLLAALEGDYATARPLLELARKAGVEQAEAMLEQLAKCEL